MKTPPIQICEQCERAFQNTWMRRSRFCSLKCRDKSRSRSQEHMARRRNRLREVYPSIRAERSVYMKQWRRKNRLKVLQDEPWSSLIVSTKNKASNIGIVHELDSEWAANRWTGECEVTKIP